MIPKTVRSHSIEGGVTNDELMAIDFEVSDSAAEHQVTVWDDHTKRAQSLRMLGAYQAHHAQTLVGHYRDPAGTQGEQFRRLLHKIDDINSFQWKCPLTRLEAWTYYF